MTRNAAVDRTIAAIDDQAWTPVSYPGAVRDPDTGAWISDAEVAESLTSLSHPPRIGSPPAWWSAESRTPVTGTHCFRCGDHPFFTNTDLATAEADVTHRQHAIIETVFADVIDGPLAHIPSGRFGANSAWVLCAAIAHNLLRAAGVLAGDNHSCARGSTLRRKIVNVPARLARPQRRPVLHLPTHWPWSKACSAVGQHHRIQSATVCDTLTTRRKARPERTGKAGQTSGNPTPASPTSRSLRPENNPRPVGRVARGNCTPGLPQIPA